MRRDVRTFTISDSTRVCSDFYDLTSLLKFIANPQCQPKLLPDALPETDRSTGYTIMLIDMANDVSTPSYYVVEGPFKLELTLSYRSGAVVETVPTVTC